MDEQTHQNINQSEEVPEQNRQSSLSESDSRLLELGGFWIRFWAYLLDLLIIGSITRMIVNPIFRLLDISLTDGSMFSAISIVSAIIFYGYFILMTKKLGQTLGKMIFGLRVIHLTGEKPGWDTVIFRELIGRFISNFIFVLYVVVAFTTKKQGIHDLFAETTVVREKSVRQFFKPTFSKFNS